MTQGDLFAGMGGFALAAEWMKWQIAFHCEWNPFGQRILKYYWSKAKSYNDITKTDFTIHRNELDILTGGFPCQGFSVAGDRLGTDDHRYLWPEMLRVAKETRPTYILGENVAGIKSMEDKSGVWKEVFARVENRKIVRYDTIDLYEAVYTRQVKMLVSTICEDLEKEGYQVQPIVIPAASVGAPHRRERIWFIAYSERNESERRGRLSELASKAGSSEGKEGEREWFRDASINSGSNKRVDTDSFNKRLQGSAIIGGIGGSREDGGEQSSRFFLTTWKDFPTQSPLCNGDDGLSSKLDGITFSQWRNESIKAGGNAIVPQVAFEIFKAIEAVNKK
jgi:DNA (cytosine-5)-methyltransferase 1